jgi:carbonic anhydrase
VKYLPELFERNRAWAAELRRETGYLERLAKIQRPTFLWIGCADSRVPANQIVGLAPGELFVQRNVANIVKPEDPNCMGVVQYGVETLGVSHIIVCGHYGCGGVLAALTGGTSGFVDEWLAPLRSLAAHEPHSLSSIPIQTRWDRLCEANVVEQVRVLVETPIVQRAWAAGRPLSLHGWIYGLHDGLLRDLGVSISRPAEGRAAVPPHRENLVGDRD